MGGLINSLVKDVRGRGSPAVRRVEDDLVTNLYDHAREQSALIGIKPYKQDDGLQRGMQLLSALHDVQTERRVRKRNVTPGSAFELVYDDNEEILQYRFAPGDDGMQERIDRQLKTYYEDSDIAEIEPEFLDLAASQYVAATRLKLRQDDSFLPIKHFKLDPDHFETDPYDSITSEMVGAPHRPNADVMVQIMIKPAISNATWDRRNWYHGIGKTVQRLKESKSGFDVSAVFEETASAITGDNLEGINSDERQNFTKYREEASNSKAANVVANQRGKKGYHVDIRVVAVSDSKEEAISRVEETAGMYRKFYDSSYEQGFTPDFFGQKKLNGFLRSMAGRQWTGTKQNITFATDTLTGICHVPTDLNTQEIEYTMSKAGRGIPPRTPRFDYDAYGLDRATSDPNEIQLAMLAEDDAEEPYWYGRGKKNGIEAGVNPEILNIHQFVGGGTGCHEPRTEVLLHDGSREVIENIEVGDRLMGPDSEPRTVHRLYDGIAPMFRIVPNKGEPFVVTADHQLTLVRTNNGTNKDGEIIDVPVHEWLGWSDKQKHLHKLFRREIDFESENNLPIDPYLLGILLGDGTLADTTIQLTTTSETIRDAAEIRADARDLSFTPVYPDGGEKAPSYRFSGVQRAKNSLTTDIRSLGLDLGCEEKYIPLEYRTASRADRLELLAGLIDSDGWSEYKCLRYSSKSAQLAEHATYLARSLGYAAYVTREKKSSRNGTERIHYRVNISGECQEIPVRVESKAVEERKQKKDVRRTGFDIEFAGVGNYYGVGVDKDHRYLMGDFTVTHNSGKTTFLTNLARQIMNRGHGCLIFDPKGKDADEFLREVPEDREDDLIFVDLSDDYDQQVTFNFMEVPSNAPPDSRAFASAVEALADDVVAVAAQAGGDDNYWGALMNRVTRTLIRGMAKSGRDCTLLDLACCVADSENLGKFYNWMDEERIHFIRESARRIVDKEDSDLEPLAGRFSQWIENDAVRNLISNPNSTVSIQDAVESGKIVVVRNDPSSGETEKRLFATALIRRAWVAIREADGSPPFYVICDEFDSIVTEESNIHKILSEARAFDFCLTLACQNPSNQLPKKVEKAVANQCRTFISYNPGGDEDARLISKQHSRGIDWEDLMNMSPYTFFMRTLDDDDQLTHSYKVRAFPPVGEVRTEQTGQPGRTNAELDALKRKSLDEYGTEQLTAEEQKEVSHFYHDQQGESSPSARKSSGMSDAAWRNQALKAVYDESIRQGDPGGWIAVEHCVGRLNAYLPGDDVTDAGKAWRKVLQEIPDPYIDRREVEDEMQVKPLDTSFLNLGDSENDGKAEHWAPMADAYVPMTQLGFIFEIPEQTGNAMPDGLARLDDVLCIDRNLDLEDIADAVNTYREEHPLLNRLAGTKDIYIESEHTTGSTQPSQTIKNLAQAHNAGHRCLFFAREDVAEQVYNTVAHIPFCCRSNHNVEGEQRFYTGTNTLSIEDETITRPGGRENVWIHDEPTGKYVLRDGEETVHAQFDSAADIFTDASAYPTGGDQNVKPPIIPEYEMNGDLSEVEWDVIVVPPETTTPLDLQLYEDDEQTPLPDIVRIEQGQPTPTTLANIPSPAGNYTEDESAETPDEQELRKGFQALGPTGSK